MHRTINRFAVLKIYAMIAHDQSTFQDEFVIARARFSVMGNVHLFFYQGLCLMYTPTRSVSSMAYSDSGFDDARAFFLLVSLN
jgi:hypothetical protein